MLQRKVQPLPQHLYPAHDWRLIETKFVPGLLPQVETLFSTSNGFLGIRGCHEEGHPVHQSGVMINGFHETWPIVYGEEAFGFARTGQTAVNVPDGKILRLYVDDEPFDLASSTVASYRRTLDMRRGFLDRDIVWEKGSGKQIRIRSRRLVSFVHRHNAAIQFEVTLLNCDAPVVISSELVYTPDKHDRETDPRGSRKFQDRVLLPQGHYATNLRAVQSYITRTSRMTLACGIDHVVESQSPWTSRTVDEEDRGRVIFAAEGKIGQPIKITKFMTYHVSDTRPAAGLRERTERALDRAVHEGFDALMETQHDFLGQFWSDSDVQVDGDIALQQVLRFNLFHICQASARADSAGVPAKGLTGHGYEGQYFWDTEIYVLPFLTYTSPRVARNLLRFRYRMLEKARQRAREVNQKGALFPWRTINGEEASAYYAAGTAQYHINADIIYALKKYVDVTGDTDFLYKEGAEMLVETARLWFDLGFFSTYHDGQFVINGVTGPDEYNTVVNNNTYTNLMARENLWYAARTLQAVREHEPRRFAVLQHDLGVEEHELADWERAADQMFIPHDEKAGIHLQDEEFLKLEPWDWENVPADKYPLLLNFHPLVIYRHRVIKQADVVLAMLLLGDEFSLEQKRRNFDFYDPLTTGDSSLSVCIQSILAFELGYSEKAREYSRYALLMDLADIGVNVHHGCHIASMGGTWMATVYGAAGMRDYNGQISFDPHLHTEFKSMQFKVKVRGQQLSVAISVEEKAVTYHLLRGEGLTIKHQGDEMVLERDFPVKKPIRKDDQGERPQPATPAPAKIAEHAE